MVKRTADIITYSRIILSMVLLFCAPLSPLFYTLYIAAGITDMTDGAVARKTGTAGAFGEKLDSIADLVFTAVCLIRLLPVLELSQRIFIWIGIIAAIKFVNIIIGFVLRKKLVTLHTMANKVTGMLLFLFPLTLPFLDITYSAGTVCAAAMFSALYEGYCILIGKPDRISDR